LFPPCLGASHPGSASPSLVGKHVADSCGLSTKMMVHLAWDAGTNFGAAMGKHLASARSIEPSHNLDGSCWPPFPVSSPGVIRCRTVFHRYTCFMLKASVWHRRPSSSFPCSIGHAVDPCSHVTRSGDEQHSALVGLPHNDTRVPMGHLPQ
jgi:hypothetical protein